MYLMYFIAFKTTYSIIFCSETFYSVILQHLESFEILWNQYDFVVYNLYIKSILKL
jgi:hypothetical protein